MTVVPATEPVVTTTCSAPESVVLADPVASPTVTQARALRKRTRKDDDGNLLNETQYIITMWYTPEDKPKFPFKCLYAGTGIVPGENDVHHHHMTDFGPDLQRFAKKLMVTPNQAAQVDGAREDEKSCVSQVDAGLSWPIEPRFQTDGKLCVKNALLNIGIDSSYLDDIDNLDSLRNVVNKLTKRKCFNFSINKITHLTHVIPHIFESGCYVFATIDGHCLSVFDGVFLDTDPKYPFPTRDLHSLKISTIVTVYRFTHR